MQEIVYSRKSLGMLYYVFAVLFVILGILFLLVAVGSATGSDPWSGKLLAVFVSALVGISWLAGTPQMWSMGKSYRRNEVRLDGSGFSLHTPAGHDIRFVFAGVRQVSWNPGLRSRLCTVETDAMVYKFDGRSCPRTREVAHLVAERAGLTLQVQKS
jgi:hypothetical protein